LLFNHKTLKQVLRFRHMSPGGQEQADNGTRLHSGNPVMQQPLYSVLQDNLTTLQSLYYDCSDVVFQQFHISGQGAVIIFIEGLTNKDLLDRDVIAPLKQSAGMSTSSSLQDSIGNRISVSSTEQIDTFGKAVQQISEGNCLLLIDRWPVALAVGTFKWDGRQIEEPMAESVIRGPREGFTELIGVNTAMIRRRIKSPALKMHSMKIGRYSETKIAIAYIEGIADPTLIEEAINRVQRIDLDGVLESGTIEEYIEDSPMSPFPQLLTTERPDVVTSNLLEGRIAFIVDGTPFVMVAPATLFAFFQSPEDHYQRFWIGTFIRWLRYLFVCIALLAPSAYVAILTYHQEMVPTTLLLSIAKSREEIPFPALVEALLMEVTFEALREAGIRLPKQVGAAVSIVGALVIGQAATSAGLVSAPMVMIVAITGIASFMIPNYTAGIAIRILRFPIMFLAGVLGLLGLMLGVITIVIHLCTLRSFGMPYLSPLAPMQSSEMKDVLIRAPSWAMNKRPHLTGDGDLQRQAPNQKPGPMKGGE